MSRSVGAVVKVLGVVQAEVSKDVRMVRCEVLDVDVEGLLKECGKRLQTAHEINEHISVKYFIRIDTLYDVFSICVRVYVNVFLMCIFTLCVILSL
jgi:hypothetical protein